MPPNNIPFNFSLPNSSRYSDVAAFVDAIAAYILQLAIPLAVIMIIYAGVKFILARGNTSKVSDAKKVLWLTLVGLGIIFIGRGFISLITSLISLPGVQ